MTANIFQDVKSCLQPKLAQIVADLLPGGRLHWSVSAPKSTVSLPRKDLTSMSEKPFIRHAFSLSSAAIPARREKERHGIP